MCNNSDKWLQERVQELVDEVAELDALGIEYEEPDVKFLVVCAPEKYDCAQFLLSHVDPDGFGGYRADFARIDDDYSFEGTRAGLLEHLQAQNLDYPMNDIYELTDSLFVLVH